MKKLTIAFLLFFSFTMAQSQDAKQLHETAKTFMRQGDNANAILVLNRAVIMEPKNISMAKDLAMAYYFQRDHTKAVETINALIDNDNADDQSFQIAGMIYRQADKLKDLEKLYKKGLKKFPESGPLYNEMGELLWQQNNYDAIKQWESGIEADPSYSKNYYNAAKFYYLSTDKVWSLIYAEIFINMEPLSNKAPEIKQILLDGYKKLFSDANLETANKDKNNFVKDYLKSMNTQSTLASAGINAESLSMIRTRFIIDWFNNSHASSFKLFSYHQQLLQEGLFEAYNQWLFGSTQNLSAYQSWVNTHTDEYNAFQHFQNGRIFKIPKGEYLK